MYFPSFVLLVVCTATVAEDKRLVLHSDLDISAALGNLQQNLTNFGNKVMQLESKVAQLESENSRLVTENNQLTSRIAQVENQRIGTRLAVLENETQQLKPETGAAVYTRWGRSACPGNGTNLVYTGTIGGNIYTSKGGASNSLCLADHPTWNTYVDGVEGYKSAIYGGEIGDNSGFSTKAFGYNYNDQDPPCAMCHTSRAVVEMFPGRSNCYPGWTMEYTGYLVAGFPTHDAISDYICLDSQPEELPHGLDVTSNYQHILYFVEAHCGSLPCPPYHQGREVACVVCSK